MIARLHQTRQGFVICVTVLLRFALCVVSKFRLAVVWRRVCQNSPHRKPVLRYRGPRVYLHGRCEDQWARAAVHHSDTNENFDSPCVAGAEASTREQLTLAQQRRRSSTWVTSVGASAPSTSAVAQCNVGFSFFWRGCLQRSSGRAQLCRSQCYSCIRSWWH